MPPVPVGELCSAGVYFGLFTSLSLTVVPNLVYPNHLGMAVPDTNDAPLPIPTLIDDSEGHNDEPSLVNFSQGPVSAVFQMSAVNLRNLLTQAPEQFKPDPSDARDKLLEKAADLHTHLSPVNVSRRGEEQWDRLVGMSYSAIIAEAYEDSPKFDTILREILVFKQDLTPSLPHDPSPAILAGTAVDWVANALHARPSHTVGAIPSAPSPSEERFRPSRRRVPSFSRSEKFNVFTFKTGDYPPLPARFDEVAEKMEEAKAVTWQQFPSHGLRVEETHGPGMLLDMLFDVTSVMQHVRSHTFVKSEFSRVSPYEYEAVSLARSLDLRLATYPSAYHALVIDPSLEVDIRRLYCILEVENAVFEGKPRHLAWEKLTPLLETTPVRKRGYRPAQEEVNRYYMDRPKENHYLDANTKSTSSRSGKWGSGGRGRGGRGGISSGGKRSKSEASSHSKKNQEN